jgi:hypothetical protein
MTRNPENIEKYFLGVADLSGNSDLLAGNRVQATCGFWGVIKALGATVPVPSGIVGTG